MNNNELHLSYHKENEGSVDIYQLAPGISISFNQIYTNSWTKGDSSVFSDQMLILNFCLHGRCDVSLAGSRYAIVGERQACVSTILPTKDFYYPGRRYEGVQCYIDRNLVRQEADNSFLAWMGIDVEETIRRFCSGNGLYLHRMDDTLMQLVQEVWKCRKKPESGYLRYMTVRLFYALMKMPVESESNPYFTRSQIAIVKEAEAMILQDLSRRITAKEMAQHFGISESSFKLYVKGILGDSYLAYFRRKRMEKAAELLKTTDRKVIEIASAVGYENQGKFAKVFAGVYGMTPLEFRRVQAVYENRQKNE